MDKILEQRIETIEKRIADLEQKEADRQAEAGLNYLKEKIVAARRKRGETVEHTSEELHALAVQIRDDMAKRGEESLKRLRELGPKMWD